MGPDRTHPSRKAHGHGNRNGNGNAKAGPSTPGSSSSAAAGAGASGHAKRPPMELRDPAGIPGVSKLKASIRQTRRFLAKDTLEPGLRITTERRLVSLEADLANAQKREVEKKNGAKYHQVKFFEKRKLLRIIKRAKKALAEDGAGGAASGEDGAKSRKKLEKELKEARIMLNYVRHYPNAQKYIALFPSSTPTEDEDETKTLKLPKLFKKSKSKLGKSEGAETEDESTIKRRQVLDRISGMMDSGSLPTEPELVLGETKTQVSLDTPEQDSKADATTSKTPKDKKDKEKKGKKGKVEEKEKEEEDDFFDVDVDEEE